MVFLIYATSAVYTQLAHFKQNDARLSCFIFVLYESNFQIFISYLESCSTNRIRSFTKRKHSLMPQRLDGVNQRTSHFDKQSKKPLKKPIICAL